MYITYVIFPRAVREAAANKLWPSAIKCLETHDLDEDGTFNNTLSFK